MKVLVAIIAYNEEENIANTIRDLKEHGPKVDIVVVDNGSTDQTRKVAESMGVKVLSHCTNTGTSMGTVTTYFRYAYQGGYDVLCQFDADGQHVAAELPKIIAPIAAKEADYVIGSRFLQKEGFQSYFLRRMGIRLFALLDSWATGQRLTDVTSGFRAYSRRVNELFAKHYAQELSDTNQLLLLSHFSGAKLKEVPVVMRAREHGVSEFRSLSALTFPIKGVVNIIGCLMQRKRMRKLWA